MDSLNILKYNLHEIHAASCIKGGELVSNLQGTRVYLSTSAWGRLWTWFYTLTKPFLKEDLKLNKLLRTIQTIEAIFVEELEIVRDHAETYEEYLHMRLNENDVDEADFHEARRGIKDWYQATKPFLKEKSLKRITDLFSKFIPKNKRFPVFLEAPEESLLNLQFIIKMEGKLQGPLPLELIHKEATSQKMAKRETKFLNKWISQFQKVGPLHKLLLSLSPFMENSDIVKFELNSVKAQNPLFKKIDPKHLLWRAKLKKGMMLEDYTVGKRVGRKAGGLDEQIFFEVQEDPNKLIMISTNRSLLGTKEAYAKEGSWGLRTPVFEYIDPKGKFAVIERFQTGLKDINWSSTNKLLPADKRVAEPIANYIHWLLKNDISVSQLDPKYLMFDREGKLRSVKIQERRLMNYPVLEQFIFDTANRNLPVYQYMMQQSGLMNSKFAGFYKAVVREALIVGMPDIASMGADRGIIDQRDIEKATELCDSIIKIKNRIVAKCRVDRKIAARTILNLYRQSNTASVLWPTLEAEARNSLG